MNPMTFDEWAENNEHLLVQSSYELVAQKAWDARQQEVDELKKKIEILNDQWGLSIDSTKSLFKKNESLKQKNAELEKKLSDAQWDFQEGDIVVKELESRCKQLQGLVDEIAHKYIMKHFDYDLNERLQLSATKREATCKQSLQVQKEDK